MYGKYVIGTREGGIPDAIMEGETGSFVDTQDADSIINTVKEIYDTNFVYSKTKCVEWAKTLDINNITKQYLREIFHCLFAFS